jgi:hypothetical protein
MIRDLPEVGAPNIDFSTGKSNKPACFTWSFHFWSSSIEMHPEPGDPGSNFVDQKSAMAGMTVRAGFTIDD